MNDFANPRDKFWSIYLRGAEEEDKGRVESWKGDMDGILIFVRNANLGFTRLIPRW
jgi:hypothetical protein